MAPYRFTVAIGIVAIAGLAAPASAQYASPALQLALRAGNIVGAAFICEVAPERTAQTGEAVLSSIETFAREPSEIQKGQQLYGEAVQLAAARQRTPEATPCESVVAAFDALEQEMGADTQLVPRPRFGFQPAPAQ